MTTSYNLKRVYNHKIKKNNGKIQENPSKIENTKGIKNEFFNFPIENPICA
jgi:hypothetical protein